MGLYDTIKNEIFCPYCGKKSKPDEFQTKSFKNYMNSIDLLKVKGVDYDFYTLCSDCNNWVEIRVYHHRPVHSVKTGRQQILRRKKKNLSRWS